MNNDQQIKDLVKEKYAAIALQDKDSNAASCCGATGCASGEVYNIMSDDYTSMEGYNPDADLGLVADCQPPLPRLKKAIQLLTWAVVPVMIALLQRRFTGEKGK
jgi:hypothetical protein